MDLARLDRFVALAGLPEAEREALAGAMSEESFPADHALASSGDFGYALYALETGGVEVFDAGGNPLGTLGAGEIFGEIALLKAGRRSATVRTTTPTVVLTLFVRDFLRVRDELPMFERTMRELADTRLAS